jgi:RNA polymerase sigma-70 factor (ECF subfamily)
MLVRNSCITQRTQDNAIPHREASRRSIEEIIAGSATRLFRHAYGRVGHREDAEDIVQETLVRACRSLSGFRSEAAVMTWLTAICTNLCIDHIRKRSRQAGSLTRLAIEHQREGMLSADPCAVVEVNALGQLVHSALSELPSDQRRLIESRDIESRSYEEIAHSLGCTAECSKVRVFRARRMLRKRVLAQLS